VVGAALESKTAWCGLIVDGRHVDPVTLRLALATRPLDRFMLVTDAMPTVGMDDKRFDLQGRSIRVENGVCVDDRGTLAGCDLDMVTAVRNAMSMLHLSLQEAVMLASQSPAAFLGLSASVGAIAPGMAANLVQLDEALQVRATWIGGIGSATQEGVA
jgi:N-acetylglucosamine-6-phosphate deacetylase